ncbi:MAG: HlyD family type I secretion periplasmic adaptor subunit, partial [Natronospirillum sp.]
MKFWQQPNRTPEEAAFASLGKLQLPAGGKGATKKEQEALSHRLSWSDSADEALETQSLLRARALLYCVLIVLVALIYWASWAQLDEVTRGEARVVPSSQRQLVQSFDGGVVSEIS